MQFRSRALAVHLGTFLFAVSSISLHAQQHTDALHEGANEYQIWAGYAPAVNPSLASITVDEPLTRAGLKWGRVMLASKFAAFKYTIDVIPVAITNALVVENTCVPVPNASGTLLCEKTATKKTAYGFGASPIGLQLNLRRRQRLQPILNGTAGFLFFNRQVPVTGSSEFNFTFSLGTGVQWFIAPSRSITLGWNFHHFSNAFISKLNPAVDSYFFYAGYSFHR